MNERKPLVIARFVCGHYAPSVTGEKVIDPDNRTIIVCADCASGISAAYKPKEVVDGNAY